MKCPRCQQDNPQGARFCEECATPLARTCSNCGTALSASAKFCQACAHPVGAGVGAPSRSPGSYTPKHLAERILTSKAALEGERKQVTVLFADLKGSMELLADRDPEEARKILDPVLELMMEAVHRYEGTVNQVMGDGIMALFGAPVAHEDHAIRACYAALRMQESVKHSAETTFRRYGVPIEIRVGLNSGEVVVRAIGSDLHMDYTAVGQTTHLAARMEQMARPGTIMLARDTLALAEGFVQVTSRGLVAVKGLAGQIEIFELAAASPVRSRLHAVAFRGLTRFVGRDAETELLSRTLGQAAQGHGQVIAVVGEPGVGKSRLVWEFIHSHRSQGWLVLETASVSYGKATTYFPVIELLRSYFGIESRDDDPRIREKVTGKLLSLERALEPTLPVFLSLLDVPVADAEWTKLDPSQRRRQTLDALKRLLLRESQVQPVLLVVEDLHWIDTETQAWMDLLVESLPAARMLLLVDYRPEYAHGWGSKTCYQQVRLDALPLASAEELLGGLMGTGPELADLRQLLINRTQGNPFFLEESVRALVETRALTGERGAYRLAGPVHSVQLPATVQAILAARIDRLAPLEKRLLQSAAVVGKDVPFGILHRIADVDGDTLRTVLTTLQAADFLNETRLFPELEYTFRHALTHEVAYEGVLLGRRRALHARIMQAIEELYGVRAPEHAVVLAHHAQHGELWEKAVFFLREAAAQAAERSAHREVVVQLRQAIEALRHLPDSRDRTEAAVDLRFALRNSLFALGQHDETLRYLHEAQALAGALGDQYRLGWVSCYLMVQCLLVGHYEQILEHGERALSAGKALGELPLQAVASMGLGQAHHAMGRYGEALSALERGVTLLRGPLRTQRFGMTSPPSVASYTWQAWCHAERGDFPDALASGREALLIAEEINDPWGRAGARFGIGLAHLLQGGFAEAIETLDAALEIARAFALRTWFPPLASALGHGCCQAGDIGTGLSLLESSVAQASAMGLTVRHSLRLCWLGEAYLAEGRIADASQMAERAMQLATDHNERGYVAWAMRLLGDVTARAGRMGEAEEHYIRATGLAEELEMRPCLARCHLELGALHARLGRVDEARQAIARSARLFDAMQMTWWSKRAAVVRDTLG